MNFSCVATRDGLARDSSSPRYSRTSVRFTVMPGVDPGFYMSDLHLLRKA